MVFGSVISSPRGNLSLQQQLDLASIYLNNAFQITDPDIILVLCHDAEVSLTHVKKAAKHVEHDDMRSRIATVYANLGDLLDSQSHRAEAHVFHRKSEKWGGRLGEPEQLARFSKSATPSIVDTPAIISSPLPMTGRQKQRNTIVKILDLTTRAWLQVTRNEPDEQERLRILATDVIRAFKRDEFKDAKAVTEVTFTYSTDSLSFQGADLGYLDSDDLVKILGLLSVRLRDTHEQSTSHLYQLTIAVSRVLDAMADADVKGLDRETVHEPLASYLDKLKGSSDSYLVYQAAYAYQALMCVPDNETLWQATLR
ncbi:hypothetical protein BGX34_008512, partial [Mortierella sp. NVP85]